MSRPFCSAFILITPVLNSSTGLNLFSPSFSIIAAASAQDTKTTFETARAFQKQGDYQNAILVLNKGLEQHPNDLDMLKELAFTYYMQRDFVKAKQTALPLVQRADADVQTFQIMGMIYKEMEERKRRIL